MKRKSIFNGLLLIVLLISGCSAPNSSKRHILFYVGSSDPSLSHPIFLCSFDYQAMQASVVDSFSGSRGSSYITLSPEHGFLYAIDKSVWDSAAGEQTISAFRVEKDSYKLEYLNSQSSKGAGPCHIHCNSDRSFIFTANYGSGSVASFPLSNQGEILPASDVVLSTGSGPNKDRQSSAHNHYVTLDPDGNFLLSPDLGTDRVMVFRFDKTTGNLVPNPNQAYFQSEPGAGPRHLDFHPSGDYLYVVNELNSTLTACRYDKDSGIISLLNTLSTITDNYVGPSYPAAVRVHPGGRFVYASNRGDTNSISVFRILDDGSIERIQVLCGVPAWPRDFNIDPEGRFILIAGEQGNEIEIYRINPDSGELYPCGGKTAIRAPANILFIDPGSRSSD